MEGGVKDLAYSETEQSVAVTWMSLSKKSTAREFPLPKMVHLKHNVSENPFGSLFALIL